jgi:hypothetical protein
MGRGAALATATMVASEVVEADWGALAALVQDAVRRQAITAMERQSKEKDKSRLGGCKRSMYRN